MTIDFDSIARVTGDAHTWYVPLRAAMDRYDISTDERAAMFLAQCAHESAGFHRLVESLHYSAEGLQRVFPRYFGVKEFAIFAYDDVAIANRVYANRYGNGNESSGDGWRYRGRGLFQLTFRDNYRAAGQALNLDLEINPSLAMLPSNAALVAAWYWDDHECNARADDGDYEGITRQINGGLNGQEQRIALLNEIREQIA